MRFVFISSVGTLLGWKDASVVVPEEPINDPRIALGNGYGESKYVTEKVCSLALQYSQAPQLKEHRTMIDP